MASKQRKKKHYAKKRRKVTKQKGRAGVPNMKKLPDGNLMNKEGVIFTPAQKKALVNEVNKATRRRKDLINYVKDMPRIINKNVKGYVEDQLAMGWENDFILAPKSKSLHQFGSIKEYTSYMENLQRINAPGYIDRRIALYKKNHMQAIMNELNDKGLEMMIRTMPKEDYMDLVVQYSDVMEIHYVYEETERDLAIERMKDAIRDFKRRKAEMLKEMENE